MENATKALLISGGVLIAIIILTVLVKTYSKIGMFQKQQLSKEEAEQIEEFNKDYTKYAGQYVHGTEIITIINKVYSSTHKVNVKVKFTQSDYKYAVKTKGGKTINVTVKAGKDLNITTGDDDQLDLSNSVDKSSSKFHNSVRNETETEVNVTVDGLKNRAFKCTEIKYDESGRVNMMRFEEIIYNRTQVDY